MKQLIILALIVYIISKLSGFFFRIGGSAQRSTQEPRRPVGNIKVDSAPKKEKRSAINGGDYVDYEEVK
ncbi:MAG TPA: hypothetical protein VL728_20070 [Cyclobacteriaceae bacterium]|nr:hypothetical protein [Cyclobacteriaceae bacterium]